MLKRCKSNINYFSAGLTVLLISVITFEIKAKDKKFSPFFKSLTEYSDTSLPKKKKLAKQLIIKNAADTAIIKATAIKDTTVINSTDSLLLIGDSTRIITIDTLSFSKDSIDSQMDYTAEDSGVLIITSKKFMLYGKANINNKDIKLDANTIDYDQETNLIKAYGGTDTSLGVLN